MNSDCSPENNRSSPPIFRKWQWIAQKCAFASQRYRTSPARTNRLRPLQLKLAKTTCCNPLWASSPPLISLIRRAGTRRRRTQCLEGYLMQHSSSKWIRSSRSYFQCCARVDGIWSSRCRLMNSLTYRDWQYLRRTNALNSSYRNKYRKWERMEKASKSRAATPKAAECTSKRPVPQEGYNNSRTARLHSLRLRCEWNVKWEKGYSGDADM